MSAPLTAWIISDGRRGIENQALGLAEAMAARRPLSLQPHIIDNGWLFKTLPAWTQFSFRKNPVKYFKDQNWPDIAIGCGRQAIAPLLALKREQKDRIFTVYVQHPRLDPSYFDHVVAPQHDQLAGPNVISIIGSPNRITPKRLAADKDMIEADTQKAAAWLIGGPSKTHSLPNHLHDKHMALLESLIDQHWKFLISTSRRTPANIISAYEALAKSNPAIKLYTGVGENPYFAYLHHANAIFVTEDSTNMLTEACATGKPVFRLPMAGKPAKFQILYDALETRCRVRPALGSDLAPQAYAVLDETGHAAEKLWTAFDKSVRPIA